MPAKTGEFYWGSQRENWDNSLTRPLPPDSNITVRQFPLWVYQRSGLNHRFTKIISGNLNSNAMYMKAHFIKHIDGIVEIQIGVGVWSPAHPIPCQHPQPQLRVHKVPQKKHCKKWLGFFRWGLFPSVLCHPRTGSKSFLPSLLQSQTLLLYSYFEKCKW